MQWKSISFIWHCYTYCTCLWNLNLTMCLTASYMPPFHPSDTSVGLNASHWRCFLVDNCHSVSLCLCPWGSSWCGLVSFWGGRMLGNRAGVRGNETQVWQCCFAPLLCSDVYRLWLFLCQSAESWDMQLFWRTVYGLRCTLNILFYSSCLPVPRGSH